MTAKDDHEIKSQREDRANESHSADNSDATQLASTIKALCNADKTDDGNALRLATFLRGRMRYVPEQRSWYWWTGKVWIGDSDGEIERELRRMAKFLLKISKQIKKEDKTLAKKLVAIYTSIRSKARMKAAIELARSVEGVPLAFACFDKKPMLFNTKNGTIDLNTGDLRPHRKEDLLTKIAGAEFVQGAPCPTWLSFLSDFTCGNDELVSYLKRLIGYSLTGLVSEQVFHLLVGEGANGKSTLIEVLRLFMGDYARQSDFSTFLETKGDRIRNDLAGLAGARIVIASEADPERAISESTVKQITGGDVISARFLFKEFFEFSPQLKLWLVANHRPRIKRNDKALWRRMRLIVANADFPDEKRRDKEMLKKLEAELSGILSWAVEGALEWQHIGLNPPECVISATKTYRASEDSVGNFLNEQCSLRDGYKISPKSLFDAYRAYCDECSIEPVCQRDFVGYLHSRKLEQTRSAGRRYWVGIGLSDDIPI